MYNNGFRRFLATIFDSVYLALVFQIQRFLPMENIYICVIWIIFYSLFTYAYSIFCHYKFGQTFGKYLMNIKVFDISETKGLTIKQAILRDSVGLVVLLFCSVKILFDIKLNRIDSQSALVNFNADTNIILGLWAFVELITMMFNKKRRAVHDYIAKTVVKKYYK